MKFITTALERFRAYRWEAKLFIFYSPSFRWYSFIQVIMDPDRITIGQYIADVLLCWLIIEIITQLKSKSPHN